MAKVARSDKMANSGPGSSLVHEARMIAPGIFAGVVALFTSVGAFIASAPFWSSRLASGAVLVALPPSVVLLVLLPWGRSRTMPAQPFSTAAGTFVGSLIGFAGFFWLTPSPYMQWWWGPVLFPFAFTYAAFTLSSMVTRANALPKAGLALHLSVSSVIYLSLAVWRHELIMAWFGKDPGAREGFLVAWISYPAMVFLLLYSLLVVVTLVKFIWAPGVGA